MPYEPVLLGILLGLLVSLVVWGYWQGGRRSVYDFTDDMSDTVLRALLVLAVLALGAFVADVLFSSNPSFFVFLIC